MGVTIKIQVSSIPQDGDNIILNPNFMGSQMIETFRPTRTKNYESGLGKDIESTVFNLYQALRTDYNGFNDFVITYDATSVDLTHSDPTFFDNVTNNTNGAVTVTQTNVETEQEYRILSVTPLQATQFNPCTHIKYEINSTTQPDEQLNPLQNQVNINSNPYTFEIARNSIPFALYFEVQWNTPNGTVEDTLFKFTVREVRITDVRIAYTPSGATVEIETEAVNSANSGQILEYSLDGVNYSQSNTFTGVTAGDYTAYVRDNFGCEKTTQFTVNENTFQGVSVEPYIYVSLLNSIRYAKTEGVFFNQDNELSHNQRNTPLFRDFVHYLKNDDFVTTQYKSSYAFNRVRIVNGDSTTSLIPAQLSNNINQTDVRDGNVVSKNGKMAVYFSGGNTYDAETGQANGNNTLEGNLLIAHVEGSYINVENEGFLRIESIEQDENYQGFFVMTLAKVYEGNPEIRRITTVYNAHNYEVFEFYNLFDQEGCYQIFIEAGDTEDDAVVMFESEYIAAVDGIDCLHTIQYYNTENNDINFGTGYRGIKRVPYEVLPVYAPKDDSDTYRTDTSVRQIEANVDEIYEFEFQPMPMGAARSLELALSQDKVFIDGLAYIKDATPSIKRLGTSNLYEFKVTMLRTEGINTNSGIGVIDTSIVGYVGVGNDVSGGQGYVRID